MQQLAPCILPSWDMLQNRLFFLAFQQDFFHGICKFLGLVDGDVDCLASHDFMKDLDIATNHWQPKGSRLHERKAIALIHRSLDQSRRMLISKSKFCIVSILDPEKIFSLM